MLSAAYCLISCAMNVLFQDFIFKGQSLVVSASRRTLFLRRCTVSHLKWHKICPGKDITMLCTPCAAESVRGSVPVGTIFIPVAYVRVVEAATLVLPKLACSDCTNPFTQSYHPLIALATWLVYSPLDISETPGNEWLAARANSARGAGTSLSSSHANRSTSKPFTPPVNSSRTPVHFLFVTFLHSVVLLFLFIGNCF